MKRYTLFSRMYDDAYIDEDPEGDLVRYEDVVALQKENDKLRAELSEALDVTDQWEDEAGHFNSMLEQVRINVTLNHLAAFEPKTDDQATNAGRFHVALYLLKRIHAAVFAEGPLAEKVRDVENILHATKA